MRISRRDAALEGTLYYAFLYGLISFVLVLVALFLIYVVCSKRYRLNWFEKDLLEKARSGEFVASSQDLLVSGSVIAKSEAGSSRSLYDDSVEDKFWVPGTCGRKSDENIAESPSSPPESKASNPSLDGVSLENGWEQESTTPQPIARSDRHVVLTTGRPRLSSMNAKLSHTKIDTSLYPKEPRSPVAEDENFGSVHISVSYDPVAGILSVRLIEARELVSRDVNGTCDPYAKIRLLPDRDNVWQTRVDKKTLNPVFDEDFVFELRPSSIAYRTLEIILYDFDPYSRHLSLGGLKLNLSEMDLSQKVTLWKRLERCSETDSKAELGNLMVSLTFLPNAERLTAVIIKARNLRIVDDSRTTTDAFVKVCLVHGSKRLKKKKTSVQKNTINPVFNEHLTFDVGRDVLSRSVIEFSVYHDSKLGHQGEVIGRAVVGLGEGSSPEERQFFQEMLGSKAAVTRWLELREPGEKSSQ